MSTPWTRAQKLRIAIVLGLAFLLVSLLTGSLWVYFRFVRQLDAPTLGRENKQIVLDAPQPESPLECVFSVSPANYRCECHGCEWLCRFESLWRGPEIKCHWMLDTGRWSCPTQSEMHGRFSTIVCPMETPCSMVRTACSLVVRVDDLSWYLFILLSYGAILIFAFGAAALIISASGSKSE